MSKGWAGFPFDYLHSPFSILHPFDSAQDRPPSITIRHSPFAIPPKNFLWPPVGLYAPVLHQQYAIGQ
jgi:hypothetical protein